MTAKTEPRRDTYSWGEMLWLIDDALADRPGLSLARMTVKPGKTSDAHSHSNCSETIHVISGVIKQRRKNDWFELQAGDTILIPENSIHQTTAIGDQPAELMIAYSSGNRSYSLAD